MHLRQHIDFPNPALQPLQLGLCGQINFVQQHHVSEANLLFQLLSFVNVQPNMLGVHNSDNAI